MIFYILRKGGTMFNWLNLGTKKSFSKEKGETMKTSKLTKQDKLVNALKDGEALTESAMKHRFSIANPRATVSALRMKGYAVYANKSKNGKTIYRLGAPLRRVVAAGYRALADEKVFG
tara:strand:- start:78 stop:431 length:354 start_codon:yes stop_codon:yes gene_type:complete